MCVNWDSLTYMYVDLQCASPGTVSHTCMLICNVWQLGQSHIPVCWSVMCVNWDSLTYTYVHLQCTSTGSVMCRLTFNVCHITGPVTNNPLTYNLCPLVQYAPGCITECTTFWCLLFLHSWYCGRPQNNINQTLSMWNNLNLLPLTSPLNKQNKKRLLQQTNMAVTGEPQYNTFSSKTQSVSFPQGLWDTSLHNRFPTPTSTPGPHALINQGYTELHHPSHDKSGVDRKVSSHIIRLSQLHWKHISKTVIRVELVLVKY